MLVLTYLAIMWRFSRPRTLLFFALILLSSITEGIGLIMLVPLLGTLQETPPETGGVVLMIVNALSALGIPITLAGLLGTFLALNIFRALIQYFQTTISENFRMELLDDMRTKSFDALLEARWGWITTQKRSDMSNLLITEINRIGTGITFSVRFAVAALSATAYILAAFSLSFPLTLVAVGLGSILFFAMRRQHSLAHAQGKQLSDANRQMQQTIEEGLAGLKLTKILRAESRHSEFMRQIRTVLRRRSLQFIHLNAAMGLIFQILVAAALVGLLYVGVEMLALSLPTLLILVLIFSRLSPQIQNIQKHINAIMHSRTVLESYNNLLAEAAAVRETTLQPGNAGPVQFKKAITLSDISYSYKTRSLPSLTEVSLTIPFRKTTAIMGKSGSGKSTLADIVMGLLSPDDGAIEIDGAALTEANRLGWRKSIAYMPQDVFLFHDSIRGNLKWADEKATEAELEAALRNASADFVFDLPDQMDTIVGDAGQRLSGGEKQRIALARALLQKPQLLILDEATSALDLENEARIRDMIERLHDELTVIVLGHRLPTLENADQLIIMEGGRVKASGKWADVQTHLEG